MLTLSILDTFGRGCLSVDHGKLLQTYKSRCLIVQLNSMAVKVMV